MPALIAGASYPDQMQQMAAADFNNDGIADLVGTGVDVADPLNSSTFLTIRLGNGDGTFQSPSTFLTAAFKITVGPAELAVGDFNEDGDLDVAIEGGNHMGLLLGNGDGSFQPYRQFAMNDAFATFPASFDVGDVNNDGHLDLVVNTQSMTFAGMAPLGLRVALGQGDGTFTPLETTDLSDAHNPLLGDFNNDGKLDAITSTILPVYSPQQVELRLGDGNGGFAPGQVIVAGADARAVADFNGDGHLDFSTDDSVFLGDGNGVFQFVVTGTGPYTADFNKDGTPDFLKAHQDSGHLEILLGVGDGTFAEPMSFPTGMVPATDVVQDFNGDGKVDVAVANGTVVDASTRIFLNDGNWGDVTPPPPPRRHNRRTLASLISIRSRATKAQ